jgi:hypothetical protein
MSVTISRHIANGAPTMCARCDRPFLIVNSHVEAWRSSDGRYFCNEFCAEEADQAAFQERRTAS